MSFVVKNKAGKEKRFAKLGAASTEWEQSIEGMKPLKVPVPKIEKLSDDQIVYQIENIVGSSFPDGDPFWSIGKFLTSKNISRAQADKAFNKVHKLKGGIDQICGTLILKMLHMTQML